MERPDQQGGGLALDQAHVASSRALCGLFSLKLNALTFTQQLENRLP